MSFKRLSILGVGLLGGSIGLAIKSITKQVEITGYGHREASLQRACELGAIDSFATDARLAVRDSDLIILCTPVGTFETLLQEIAQDVKDGAVLTDVGSTKRSVCELGERILPKGVHFVGSHPMAGSEKRGVEAASSDLFKQALCILTPTPQTNSEALRQVESFWQSLGMRLTRVSPADHDRLLADVSHLPHLLAAMLVMNPGDDALNLAGKGFLDSTRISAGDAGLWRDILLDNRDNVKRSLDRIIQRAGQLRESLAAGDSAAIEAFLAQAARRSTALRSRNSSNPPRGDGE
jgi:prephenate dehydrogenase